MLTVATEPATSDDFTTPPAALTIEAGETTATITVSTTDEASEAARRAEAQETFTLELGFDGTPPPGVVLGKETATGTIRDNDSVAGEHLRSQCGRQRYYRRRFRGEPDRRHGQRGDFRRLHLHSGQHFG